MAKTAEEEAKETGTAEDIDKLSRRQVRVTKEHNEECKRLLGLMGIPVVTVSYCEVCCTISDELIVSQAPGEAEAQCAELARAGKVFADLILLNCPLSDSHQVYAAGSEDMDTLTFNSPILLRHLTFSEAKKMPISEINLKVALEELGMDMDKV